MPCVSRVSVVNLRAGTTDVVIGHVHIRVPRDGLVHILKEGAPFDIIAWPDGTVDEAFIAIMDCGCRTKVNSSSRSRYTNEPATCIVCLGGGYA